MKIDLVTGEDLEKFRLELLRDIQSLLEKYSNPSTKKWLKSYEVMTMLNITKNTLKTYRSNGTLKGKKVGGVYFYSYNEIQNLLESLDH